MGRKGRIGTTGKQKSRGPAVLLAMELVSVSILAAQDRLPTIDVAGPTIVAFFVPATDAELRKEPDTNEALSDFQFYAGQVREPLTTRGITFKEVYADAFTLRQGKVTTMYALRKMKVGYCLVAPSKEPYVQSGVLTDADLLQLADKYFAKPKK